MTQYVTEILLWLFVINLGIVFGAGLYEARIIVSQWVNSPSTYRWPDTGPKFWVFVTTVPLTLLTIANVVAVAGPGCNACLVVRCGRGCCRGEDYDLHVLHSHKSQTAAPR